MKTYIFVMLLAILYGCGDNGVSNNPVNPNSSDTVQLFSKDSIYTGNLYSGRDSVEFTSSVSVDTLHVTFTLVSENVTGLLVKCYTYEDILSMIPYSYTKEYHLKFALNSTFTCKTYLELMGAGGSPYFASLKNIKLWYIKRN